jgi:hypothetical protein
LGKAKVNFAKDASSSVIKSQIKGDTTVDYVVRAAAGQMLSVKLGASERYEISRRAGHRRPKRPWIMVTAYLKLGSGGSTHA